MNNKYKLRLDLKKEVFGKILYKIYVNKEYIGFN